MHPLTNKLLYKNSQSFSSKFWREKLLWNYSI